MQMQSQWGSIVKHGTEVFSEALKIGHLLFVITPLRCGSLTVLIKLLARSTHELLLAVQIGL